MANLIGVHQTVLGKKHKVGAILKEGTKQYKIVKVKAIGNGMYLTHFIQIQKNPKKKIIKKRPVYGTKGTFKRDYMKAVDKVYKALGKKKNPSTLLKAGEWVPAHAVRVYKGKLEILK